MQKIAHQQRINFFFYKNKKINVLHSVCIQVGRCLRQGRLYSKFQQNIKDMVEVFKTLFQYFTDVQMLSWTKVVVLQWLATTSPDHTLTIHRQYCHFDMFNYLKNGTAILKPNIAIGPVKGPKYPFKFSSFKCLAGKWLDSSNVLTVQGNWGSLERKATFGEILIVLMIDRDFCWGWQRLVLVIEMMISNETFHHLWKKSQE